MNTCSTCTHWKPFEDKNRFDADPVDFNELGLCGAIVDKRSDEAYEVVEGASKPKRTLALVEDLSGCAGLRTHATFFCALWSRKP